MRRAHRLILASVLTQFLGLNPVSASPLSRSPFVYSETRVFDTAVRSHARRDGLVRRAVRARCDETRTRDQTPPATTHAAARAVATAVVPALPTSTTGREPGAGARPAPDWPIDAPTVASRDSLTDADKAFIDFLVERALEQWTRGT